MSDILNLDLLARVIDVIAEEGIALRSEMEPHSGLHGDLGLKHIDIIDMHLALEAELDVVLPHRCEESWRTLADVVRSVELAIATPRCGSVGQVPA